MKKKTERGEKPLSERPIAIQDDDLVHVVGASFAAVREALQAFADGCAKKPKADPVGYGAKYLAAVLKHCARALEQKDALSMPTRDWNYCTNALTCQGITCVMTDLG